MDIGAMSVVMNQASLQSAVSMSVLKLAMNSQNENGAQITEMMSNMAVDMSKGTNIDARV